MTENGKKLRVALCFSGHCRTFMSVWPSWERHVLPYHNVDVFCHLWDTYGPALKSLTPEKHTSGVGVSDIVDITKVWGLCSPVSLVIESYESKRSAFNIESEILYHIRDRLGVWKRDQPSANISMYYTIWMCNQLKRAYEELHNFTYDMVIRTRFDVNIAQPIPSIILDDLDSVWSSTNAPGGPLKHEVNDVCFVTNSKNIDVMTNMYATFYKRLPDYVNRQIFPSFINPHLMYNQHIIDNELSSKKTAELDINIIREDSNSNFGVTQ